MNTLDALLSGIVADPLEETRWLVLADYLEENDDPRRAELLRLHRRLLNTCLDPPITKSSWLDRWLRGRRREADERSACHARVTELLVLPFTTTAILTVAVVGRLSLIFNRLLPLPVYPPTPIRLHDRQPRCVGRLYKPNEN